MSGLTDFLLARIGEDEKTARWLLDRSPALGGTHAGVCHPARALIECEAKRRIVALNDADYPTLNDAYGCDDSCAIPYVLRLLALPYADHPDYREEWKP